MKIFLEKKNDTAILLWFEDTENLPYKRGNYEKDFNLIHFVSSECPELGEYLILLPGDKKEMDSNVSTLNFYTHEGREKTFEKLAIALQQFAASFNKSFHGINHFMLEV